MNLARIVKQFLVVHLVFYDSTTITSSSLLGALLQFLHFRSSTVSVSQSNREMKVFFIFIWAFIYPSSIKSKLFEYQKHIKKNRANIAFIQSLILLHNNSIISSPSDFYLLEDSCVLQALELLDNAKEILMKLSHTIWELFSKELRP